MNMSAGAKQLRKELLETPDPSSSAVMPVYACNLNRNCKVKLTDFGEHLLLERNPPAFKFNYDQKTNILSTELWSLMNIFGDQLYNGAIDLPFVNNEIFIGA